MASLESVPKPSDSFCVREIGDEIVFLAESGDEIHSTGEVGAFIWKAIDGERSLGGIVELICKEYEIDPGTATDDLDRFIGELAAKGIIELGSTN